MKTFFLSYRGFSNEHRCHKYVVQHENGNDVFVVIHTNYEHMIAENFRLFSNVKHVYYYGNYEITNEKVFRTQVDLCYRLTYDLIGYYGELGERYQNNSQPKLARDVFLKGQKLCQFLSEKFFSK